MSNGPLRAIDFATLLYRQLPAVYRERDNGSDTVGGTPRPGDLALLLSDWGDLLDALYRTLQQRYYDIFPETEGEPDPEGLARGCQDWVLPYIAELLDVKLVSPLDQGQRHELGRAVEWRQRKGTPLVIEDIAEAVAVLKVEICEGWRKVAVTPWAGFKLLPAEVFGEPDPARFGDPQKEYDPRHPARRAEHPGLPGGTIDFRRASCAVNTQDCAPATKIATVGKKGIDWRQAWPHGAPCFPDSFQDASARTVDLRTPDSERGHAHPRRVVLYAAPFPGFFAAEHPSVLWSAIEAAVLGNTPLPAAVITQLSLESVTDALTGRETRRLTGLGDTPVRISGVIELKGNTLPDTWEFTKLWFDNRMDITHSQARFEGCAVCHLHIHDTSGQTSAALTARNSLFMRLFAPTNMATLEYVTVLDRLVVERLNASDCLLIPPLRKDPMTADTDVPRAGCIRFSRIDHPPTLPSDPQWIPPGQPSALKVFADSCTKLTPIFWNTRFGSPGCGVLHPQSDKTLRFGAEDGGEMGAYHDFAYTLREQAVMEKLKDTLPVGIEAVLAPDPSLGIAPPVLRQAT
ncbi:MAG: hypothetical protein KAY13_01105 [Zoogloea sp.]|nr:hypothetical protein [Zoogloea sp.]